ncbi:MAG: hypothetical protein LBN74_06815 [Prevotella sp.]|nr:hypothetical protein [Prevotella sp.]
MKNLIFIPAGQREEQPEANNNYSIVNALCISTVLQTEFVFCRVLRAKNLFTARNHRLLAFLLGSSRKTGGIKKNDYLCIMETSYELLLPEGILEYFELKEVEKREGVIKHGKSIPT